MSDFWRGIALITAGAILHFAVTVTTPDVDLQTTGLVLLCVGLLDLVLSIVFVTYERGWWDARRPAVAQPDPYPAQSAPYGSREHRSEAAPTLQLPPLRDRR